MNKNFNLENAKSIIAEASGVPVNTTFGSITKPIDLLLEVIDMSADLIALIHEETELKKHHRAYLHVHEELEDCADQMAERMQEIFDETTDCVIKLMKDVHETFRVRKQEAAEDDADTVTIAKEDYNGFDDDTLRLLGLEVKEVPEMPDPAFSVQDMKDYGYAWAGVLPAGQEAAEKALEKGCEVYRLYSDNTEGLCVDAKEIADHAAKGGMLGISKESWMAALEKENYLKAAEMSMEDDYGMIDGIINNGPKEGKTAEVKAPERGEKSSIMDRLKSAKAEKQKECCPPKKHKGEIEL